MFPKTRKAMSSEELYELGIQLQNRKQDLESGLLTRTAKTAVSALGSVIDKVGERSARTSGPHKVRMEEISGVRISSVPVRILLDDFAFTHHAARLRDHRYAQVHQGHRN